MAKDVEKFEAHYDKQGRLVIKVKAEEVTNEDGSKSVVIKAPSLSLINKAQLDHKQKK